MSEQETRLVRAREGDEYMTLVQTLSTFGWIALVLGLLASVIGIVFGWRFKAYDEAIMLTRVAAVILFTSAVFLIAASVAAAK